MNPNNPNSVNNFFGVKVSKQGIPVNQASDKQLVYKDDYSTKTYFDTTNSRMVEGKLPDGTYGMWVSKPGFDVTTASGSQLVFNSNQDVFKIVNKGSAVVPSIVIANGASGSTGAVVAHNLGFAPIANLYINLTTFVWNGSAFVQVVGNYPLPVISKSFNPGFTLTTSGSLFTFWIYGVTDSTNLYLTAYFENDSGSSATTAPLTITYYLLQETAT